MPAASNDQQSKTIARSIWQELDEWAKGFDPYKRSVSSSRLPSALDNSRTLTLTRPTRCFFMGAVWERLPIRP
jgi:hypothetical protein